MAANEIDSGCRYEDNNYKDYIHYLKPLNNLIFGLF